MRRRRSAWDGRFGVPGQQDGKDLLLGKLDGELVDRAFLDLAPEIASGGLAVGAHAAVEPLLEREVDVQVDGADQVTKRAALLLRA
jgi:hypothetical protein